MTVADINWNAIRSLNGSQRDGFEELCAQLARAESPPNATFTRTGSPDAGVECYCVLPNDGEWGWQAKFFTAPLRDPQWRQLDESVKRALDAHPNLTRYIVCAPRDRSDGRRPGKTTELQRWEERVGSWAEWAAHRNMHVEFVWWGLSELTERLTDKKQAGRAEYWFGDPTSFSRDWFSNRLDEAISSVGPRYTPESHIDVSVSKKLNLFGRADEVLDDIRARATDLRDAFGSPTLNAKWYADIDDASTFNRLQLGKASIPTALSQLNAAPDVNFDVTSMTEEIADAIAWAGKLISVLSERAANWQPHLDPEEPARGYQSNPYADERRRLYRLQDALSDTLEQLEEAGPLVNGDVLILTGEAGIGKTHLLCDIARQRVVSGLPTILLTGQRFLTKEGPWVQALQHLDLSGLEAEVFLGALQAAAQSSDARALLVIDAINEGEGPAIWPSNLGPFLQHVKRFPEIACIISVRSTYDDATIPEHVRANAITVHHTGFADRSYHAARAYFEHYSVPLPSTPLLQPEFDNPLFLKLFCQSLSGKAPREIPSGFYGISEVFSGLLDDVNTRLSTRLDYNPNDKHVHAALSALAANLAQQHNRWIPQSEAAAIADPFVPSTGFSRSLYRALVSEGLLLENPDFRDQRPGQKIVSIAFERLADHLIAEHLIDTHITKTDPAAAFQPTGSLPFLLDEDNYLWRGVLEALCVQIPESFGLELPQLIPTLFDSRWARSAFLTSLTWRSPGGWSDETRHQFDELLRRPDGLSPAEVFDVLLMIATVPGHPLNAHYLHELLKRWSMPDRDTRWSIYLHDAYAYGDDGPVHRLLDWANDLSAGARASLDDDVVELTATTLAWMLTASNRFVRDRATKGLVWILTGRPEATRRLVERFCDADDLYVAERVYAVAYGVATRCHEPADIKGLATVVYRSVFANGEPTPHILLRDYARGVVERALHLGADIHADATLIRPPYRSEWPNIPSDDELQQLAPRPDMADVPQLDRVRGENAIHFSVMDWDFAKYIIGADRNMGPWLAQRLGEQRWIPPEEQMEALVDEFSDAANATLRDYQATKSKVPMRIRFVQPGDDPSEPDASDTIFLGHNITDEEYDILAAEAARARGHFLSVLNPQQRERILAIEQARGGKGRVLDHNAIQRYVLWRVFDLGWTVDLFGQFDSQVNLRRFRESGKPERIGKKYQWIAYHEILAYISDHYQFDSGYSDDLSRHRYSGPWQIHRRDIDPTASTRMRLPAPATPAVQSDWWRGPDFENWRHHVGDREWLDLEDDLGDPRKLLQVRSTEDGTSWLNFRALRAWREPSLVELDEDNRGRRQVWIHANAYLVDVNRADEFYRWTQGVDFWGRWMPEPQHESDVFLGEHGWSPASMEGLGAEFDKPVQVIHEPVDGPVPVYLTACEYLSEARGYDCSIEESHMFLVPSPIVISGMELRWSGNGADFHDSEGQRATFDPEPIGSDASLLVREGLLRQFLERDGLALVWTVLGEKMAVGGTGDWAGSLHFTGAYRYESEATGDDRIQGALRFRQQYPGSRND